MSRLYFFVGKGGVGKTTCAAAFAINAAEAGLKALIVSLDPAHNLGDVLGMKLGEKPREVLPGLYASEIDFDRMIQEHLRRLSDEVKDIYGYLRVFNLEGYIDVLRNSPGVEEYATLEKVMEIVKVCGEGGRYDLVVFDTPPTGLTVRVMALPTVSLIWLDKLMDLRLEILGRRRAVKKVTGEVGRVRIGGREFKLATEPEEDPIYRELAKMKVDVEFLNKLLTDPGRTSVVMVVNPELLPLLEAERAFRFLKRVGVPVKYLVINKVLKLPHPLPELRVRIEQQEGSLRRAAELFKGLKVVEVPLIPEEPRGINALRRFKEYLKGISLQP